MSLQGNYTAEIVTYARARASLYRDPAVRNPDYLSRKLLNLPLTIALCPGVRALVRVAYDLMTPGIYLYLHMRTGVIDHWFEHELDNNGVSQLVVVGAGMDSRPYRYKERLKEVRVFECDHPMTADLKKKRLARRGIASSHVTYLNVDLRKESIEEKLSAAGFSLQAKSIVLCEGLLYYLPTETVDNIFSFVAKMQAGTSIIFDYVLQDAYSFPESHYGVEQLFHYLERKKEPICSALSYDKLAQFLKPYGLEVDHNEKAVMLTDKYLRRSNGESLGKICAAYGIAKARRI